MVGINLHIHLWFQENGVHVETGKEIISLETCPNLGSIETLEPVYGLGRNVVKRVDVLPGEPTMVVMYTIIYSIRKSSLTV